VDGRVRVGFVVSVSFFFPHPPIAKVIKIAKTLDVLIKKVLFPFKCPVFSSIVFMSCCIACGIWSE